MSWHAALRLDYTLNNGRSVAHYRHDGPLRILQSLYPEGDAICHNVLVHPPGGLVGGDTLEIQLSVATGAHGLVTTPAPRAFTAATVTPPPSKSTPASTTARGWNGCPSKPWPTRNARPTTRPCSTSHPGPK